MMDTYGHLWTLITKHTFLILFVLVLISCDSNRKCRDMVCYNGGSCWQGECNCPNGFYGDNCEYLDSNFTCPSILECIENNYNVRQACLSSGNKLYTSTISRLVTDTNSIALSNFADKNFELICQLQGTEILIEAQLINGILYQGEGSVDTTSYPYIIEVRYKAGNTNTCLAEFRID